MDNLIELTQQITRLHKSVSLENERHAGVIEALKLALAAAIRERDLYAAGIDLRKIHLAESCFSFYGDPSAVKHGDYADQHHGDTRTKLIEDAIHLIGESQDALSKRYLGVKNYASFGDQREDHEYYMGPRHGDIVFCVKRTNRESPLTDEQREAAIYYLLNWKKIYSESKAA